MNSFRFLLTALFCAALSLLAAEPQLPGITAALSRALADQEIAGAVTLVVTPERVVHFETHGFADLATQRPMSADTMFNIMSMTKPITAVAILMLQDDGKLRLTDPVAKFLPEFAALKPQRVSLPISRWLSSSRIPPASARPLVPPLCWPNPSRILCLFGCPHR